MNFTEQCYDYPDEPRKGDMILISERRYSKDTGKTWHNNRVADKLTEEPFSGERIYSGPSTEFNGALRSGQIVESCRVFNGVHWRKL